MSYGLEVGTYQYGTLTSNPSASIHFAEILITLQLIQRNVIYLSNGRAYLRSGLEPNITGNNYFIIISSMQVN